jgi:hypothetical protein
MRIAAAAKNKTDARKSNFCLTFATSGESRRRERRQRELEALEIGLANAVAVSSIRKRAVGESPARVDGPGRELLFFLPRKPSGSSGEGSEGPARAEGTSSRAPGEENAEASNASFGGLTVSSSRARTESEIVGDAGCFFSTSDSRAAWDEHPVAGLGGLSLVSFSSGETDGITRAPVPARVGSPEQIGSRPASAIVTRADPPLVESLVESLVEAAAAARRALASKSLLARLVSSHLANIAACTRDTTSRRSAEAPKSGAFSLDAVASVKRSSVV